MNKKEGNYITSRDFVYWLQGYFEINDVNQNSEINVGLNYQQVEVIQRHLSLVFTHEIDPSYGSKEHINELNELHDTTKNKILNRPPGARC